MKYLLLFFFLIPLVYAQNQDITIYKEAYYPKETFQAEVFSSYLKATDVVILNSLNYPTNIGINLIKISNSHYFIFFDVPSLEPGNYFLKVRELQKQFEIKPKIENILSIYPGAIKYSLEDSSFSKVIINNYNNQPETISITSSSDLIKPSVNSLIIPGKSSKSFYITLNKDQKDNFLANLEINNYKIPVWFIIKEEVAPLEKVSAKEQQSKGLEFYIKSDDQDIYLNYITKEIQESTPIVGSIYLRNTLNETLNNLKISLAGNIQDIVDLGLTKINSLMPNEELELSITINENRLLLLDSYSGDLIVSSDEYEFKLPMNFIVVESAEEPESLTIEEAVDIPKNISEIVNKTGLPKEGSNLQVKWLYLLALIVLFVVLAFIFSRKPKLRKQSFNEYISRFKR